MIKITIEYHDSYKVTLEVPEDTDAGIYDVQQTAIEHVMKLVNPYDAELCMNPPEHDQRIQKSRN